MNLIKPFKSVNKIDWKSRIKNPIFWFNNVAVFFSSVLAYYGLSGGDLTTWNGVFELVKDTFSNPFLLVTSMVGVWNNIIDTSSYGVGDNSKIGGVTDEGH